MWLTGPGIYSGSFSFGSQNAGDSIIHDYKLIPYSNAVHGSPVWLRPDRCVERRRVCDGV